MTADARQLEGSTYEPDTSLRQAKRAAFDNPTQANLDALIAIAKSEGVAYALERRIETFVEELRAEAKAVPAGEYGTWESDIRKTRRETLHYCAKRLAALVRAGGVERTPDLHSAIMNIPCEVPSDADDKSYRIGHREARHAAAELVAARGAVEPSAQEQKLDLEAIESRLRIFTELNSDWLNSQRDGSALPGLMRIDVPALLAEVKRLRSARPSPPSATRQEESSHGRIEVYGVEPDQGGDGDWHRLTFTDGWQIQIFTDRPLVVIEPEKH
jgi:hypothetical protein